MDDVVYFPDDATGPGYLVIRSIGGFKRPSGPREMRYPTYRFIEDEKQAERIVERHKCLRRVPGDRLNLLLGDSASHVIGEIQSGECDDILDVVLWVERSTKNRSSVIEAIAERSDALEAQQAQQIETSRIDPKDITTA